MEIDILGDERDLAFGVVSFKKETSGKDAVVDAFAIREDAVELLELLGVVRAACGIVDDEADGAAAFGGDAIGDDRGGGEDLGQAAVGAAGVGTALGLLAFEFIQLGKDIDEDADVIFLEALQARGIVEEDVGIENVVFPKIAGSFEAEVLDGSAGGGDPAGFALGGCDRGGFVKQGWLHVLGDGVHGFLIYGYGLRRKGRVPGRQQENGG